MRVSTRFPIAVHILLFIAVFTDKHKLTSDFIAGSVNSNPVIIRNILGQLKKREIVEVVSGTGGAKLKREPKDITLWQIYMAIEPAIQDGIFKFHDNPEPRCPVGGNIYTVLSGHFDEVIQSMKSTMSQITLQQLLTELGTILKKQKNESSQPDKELDSK